VTDWAAYATSTGTVFVATIGPDGLISGFTTCVIDVLSDHLAATINSVPVMPDQAALFSHGTPFALIDGLVVASSLPLDEVKRRRVASLRATCAATITGGFASSGRTYPSRPADQANMTASISASLFPNLPADWTTPFWCADGAGVWEFRSHTAARIQQVGTDGKAMIVGAQTKLAELLDVVAGATTEDQVLSAIW